MRQGFRTKGNVILDQKIGKKEGKGAAMPRTKGKGVSLHGKERESVFLADLGPKLKGNVFCIVLEGKGKVLHV